MSDESATTGQGGGEAKTTIFTEYHKKDSDGTYATYHVVVREGTDGTVTGAEGDELALARLKWWDTNLTNMGYTQGDSPKINQYPPRGQGGSGQQPRKRADIPADGKFQVESLRVWEYNNSKQIKVTGVNGEEVTDWGGKQVDALLKKIDPKATGPFMGWADWKPEEAHPIGWTTHKLIAVCEQSTKKDKNGKPYWNIKEYVVE